MGNFSRLPLETLEWNLQRGFVGLHVEQGVPVLDRDLNLLQDLITAQVRKVFTTYIGNGIAPDDDAFAIHALSPEQENNFAVGAGPGGVAGTCLVNGLEVTIESPTSYAEQPKASDPAVSLPPLTTPSAGTGTRMDTVYLELFLEEVRQDTVSELGNPMDVGMQTSVRVRPGWCVRVAEDAEAAPAPPFGTVHYELARLHRTVGQATITQSMIEDRRQQRLNVASIERRLRLMEELLTLPRFSSGTTAATRALSRPTGRPGEVVQLRGNNFGLGSLEVRLGPIEIPSASVVLGSNPGTGLDTLDVTIPTPEDDGLYNVLLSFEVSTAGGTVTAPLQFRVLPPELPEPGSLPVFSTLTTPTTRPVSRPNARPGETVTIRGTHFLPNPQVTVGGESAVITDQGELGEASLQFVTFTLPDVPAGQHPVVIRTEVGPVASPLLFQVLAS